jgi:hypothetical protein
MGEAMSFPWVFGNRKKTSERTLSVPTLDGAFRPNSELEESAVWVSCPDPDNLIQSGDLTYFSSGAALLSRSKDGVVKQQEVGDAEITALAAAADGALAIARSGKGVTLIDSSGKRTPVDQLDAGLGDVTSMAFVGSREVALTIGARGRRAHEWQTDFLLLGRSGSVWVCDDHGRATKLTENLAYPCGVVADDMGNLIVSVAWDSELVRLDRGGKVAPVLENLPGYPSRLIRSAAGGYWLAVSAPRNQLVEFVLRETAFRDRMMAEIEPSCWICPSHHLKHGPLDASQQGAHKIGGLIKPWAPSLSYGMVVRLDTAMLPVHSFQSQANGTRHGVTSVLEQPDRLLVSSRGANAIVEIPLDLVNR